mgnify:CR=1 FL=1
MTPPDRATQVRALLTGEKALSGFVHGARLSSDLLDGTERGIQGLTDAILPDLMHRPRTSKRVTHAVR